MGRKKGAADADDGVDCGDTPNGEDGDGIVIEIEKTGTYSRKICSNVAVQASLQIVWDVLTDYERLVDFIPGLTVSRLVEKRDNFARVFQIGEQKFALGLKFNAKATIDCFEKDLEMLPFGKRRNVEFKMVEGDLQIYEGKWSIVERVESNSFVSRGAQTTLMYSVNVESKMWLPISVIEERLYKEIRTNMWSLRKEAEKRFKTHSRWESRLTL